MIPCCIPIQSSKAAPPIWTPSGIYVQKLPSYVEVVNKATTIAAIRNITKIVSDHFCNLLNCLTLNQFNGITIVQKTTINDHIRMEGKNSCTVNTRIIPSKAQYKIKFDA